MIEPDSAVFDAEPNVSYAAARPGEIAMLDPGKTGPSRRPDAGEARIETDDEVFSVDANITFVSDYRARGLSASAGKVALQGELAVAHRSGLYASLWASNMADNGGADIETNLFLGYSRALGPLKADVGLMGYVYPGASALNYYEIQGALGVEVGKAELSVNVAYGPRQRAFEGADNIYVELTGEVPLGKIPASLVGGIGIEDGYFGDKKIDWRLGAIYEFKGFELGVTYVDSARTFGAPDSGPTVVGSLAKNF